MNYNNPYNQYPYTNYGYQQPYNNQQYQQAQQYQTQVQNQQSQQNFMNLLVVNGYDEVEKYIVMANQTVNFFDNKNMYIYVKSADGLGKYSIKAFKLNEIDIKDIGKEINEDKPQYITRTQLDTLENVFNDKIDKLSSRIEKLSKTQQNNYKQKGNE